MTPNTADVIRTFLKWINETKEDDGDKPELHWDTHYYPAPVKEAQIEEWLWEFQVLLAKGQIKLVEKK